MAAVPTAVANIFRMLKYKTRERKERRVSVHDEIPAPKICGFFGSTAINLHAKKKKKERVDYKKNTISLLVGIFIFCPTHKKKRNYPRGGKGGDHDRPRLLTSFHRTQLI